MDLRTTYPKKLEQNSAQKASYLKTYDINDTLDRNDEILPYEIEINPCSRINFVSIEKFRI